jgi:hypothetical protein
MRCILYKAMQDDLGMDAVTRTHLFGEGISKDVKIGVREGQESEDGPYLWSVMVLDLAFREAMKFLDGDQYAYVADQVKALATEHDPTHSVLCSVDAIEDFHELREKHGPLGNINVRIFFFVHKPRKWIVVLGAIKKTNNGPTPLGARVTMRRRKRLFIAGTFGIRDCATDGCRHFWSPHPTWRPIVT